MAYRSWLLAFVAIIVIGIAWHQVFVMTGILWWDAPEPTMQPAPPPPLVLTMPDTSWVDLSVWQRNYPVWAAL
ncbi:MAG: hypothetical protein GX358_10220 [candidate division WS1 bacterium]|jgi:hypothetical protein|nr:hypothetical protein [candidate division WS1 bacterium]